ncbi:MAG TPA: hypothetical protein GX740_04805 [Acholeplasmataceae bacterium]|nr:hypothetical protein [Acholeplasmataceae bacterium]
MKVLRIFLFLLLGLALIGCNQNGDGNNNDNNDNDNDGNGEDIVEPSLKIESTEYKIENGLSLQLNIEIVDSDEELGIIYLSSNDAVASVSTTGLVKANSIGTAQITAILASYPDQKLVIDITVYEVPMDEVRARIDFDYILGELAKIPDVVENDITLHYFLRNREINWEVSNTDVIDNVGRVTRQDEDVQVTLTATMSYKHIEEVFEKVVTVKKKLPMRNLANEKVAMAYSREIMMKQEHIEKLDVINYSFAGVTAAFRFSITSSITTLVRRAHNVGTRVVAAVGGWGAGNFSEMTATQANRKIFIDSVIEAIKEYDLDGIDYDWEYPTAAERDNFTALVKETREAMDNYKPGLLLTSAFSAAAGRVNVNYNVGALNNYLDYFNMMTYDYNDFSEGEGHTRHHTNLYDSTIAPSSYSADKAIKAYINGGASPEKIVIGVAAYGRVATEVREVPGSNNGINARGHKPNQSIRLDDIYRNYYNNPETKYKYYFDEKAQAPWLFDGSTFISFDDTRSVKAKADYTYLHNLGGMMYWDYMNDNEGRVVDWLYEYLNKQPKA